MWQGEDINDQTILVHSEQGNGDHIMFWRFLPLLAERCKSIIYVGPEDLAPLVAEIPGVSQSRIPGVLRQDLFDVYCPLMSVPRHLGITLDNLPAPERYINIPKQVVVSELKGEVKIGIAWAGSATHVNDANRSMSLQEMLKITAGTAAQFYSLQMPISAADRQLLKDHKVTDLEPELPGYARSAALVDQLDLVITVDTAMAHLSAALGKPTWILLGHNSDWRWHLEQSSSEWYPTAKLFRKQAHQGSWDELLDQVNAALKAFTA